MLKKKWEKIVTRNMAPFHEYTALKGYKGGIPGITNWKREIFDLIIAEKGKGSLIYHEFIPSFRKSLEIIKQEFKRGRYDKRFFQKLSGKLKYCLKIAEKIHQQKKFISKSNKELLKLTSRYWQVASLPYGIMLFGIDITRPLGDEFERILIEKFKYRKNRDELENLIKILIAPPQVIPIAKEKKDFLKIILEVLKDKKTKNLFKNKNIGFIKNNLPKINLILFNKIIKHVQNYGWITMEYVSQFSTLEDYIQNIAETLRENESKEYYLLKLKEIEKKRKKTLYQKNSFFRQSCYSKKEKNLLLAISWGGYFFEYSKLMAVKMNFLTKPLFEEIGKRMGLNWLDVMHYLPEEIDNFLKTGKKLPLETIKKRKDFRVLINKKKNIEILTGKEAKDFVKENIKEEVISAKINKFSGTSANRGLVKGKARIVLNSREQSKVKAGDILVVKNTTPEFLPSIKKAGAIVAEEGGLLCHAAIISRELGIPCIIGTKIATEVLKDGDLVEVDAEKGIVRILKRGRFT